MTLALFTSDHHKLHDEPSHPEHAARLDAILAALGQAPELSAALERAEGAPASDEDICRVHQPALLRRLERIAATGGEWLTPDTYVLPDSVACARWAAGQAMAAANSVLSGAANQAFALVRPPGHHATPGEAMGFCLFNNVAVAARFAQAAHGVRRIAIIDWDVHHGNGTQDCFVDDPDVLYVSTHGWPLYPGTGHWREMGGRAGLGATLNLPLGAYTGDLGLHRVFSEAIVPAVRRFKPELIIISAGYDAHLHDPLGILAVSTAGYANLAAIVYNLAAECCGGRLIGVLEGGYNLQALADSTLATLAVWAGLPAQASFDAGMRAEPDVSPLINQLTAQHPLLQSA